MLSVILIAIGLVAATIAVHSVGLALVLRSLMKSRATLPTGMWAITLLLIRLASWLIMISLLEVGIWGLFYLGQECLPDAESASETAEGINSAIVARKSRPAWIRALTRLYS